MQYSNILSDFFLFKKFISTDVLIGFYFLGSVILPLVAWKFALFFVKKFNIIQQAYDSFTEKIWSKLSLKQKIYLLFVFVGIFLFCEILWRMMFEFLIAYMQIRDALVS